MIPLCAETLNEDTQPWQVRVFDELGSTSDWLKHNAEVISPETVIFTESQTAGRGRRENRWISPRGRDLIFSMLLRPAAGVECWPRLTTLAALGICKAIEAELPLAPCIKWPNDIYLEGLKTGGLLAETVTTRQGLMLVLGIGLNVNTLDFPPDLRATSLLKALAAPAMKEIDRNALGRRVLQALQASFEHLQDGWSPALAEVRERSWLLHRQVRAQTPKGEVYGRVLDLDEEGHLLLETGDGSVQALTSADHVRAVM